MAFGDFDGDGYDDLAVGVPGEDLTAGSTAIKDAGTKCPIPDSTPCFPVKNAFQPEFAGGNNDAFVTKLNATGTDVVYSTYLGSDSASDLAWDLAIDSGGNAYVTGYTDGADFPVVDAPQPGYGGGLQDSHS